MNKLLLTDVLSFLIFLLRTNRAALDAVPAAAGLTPTLEVTLTEIEALPPESFGGAPNAEQLASVDGRHDGNGESLYYLALAYKASPLASAAAKEAAQLIIDAYVPGKNHLRASYATEASRAETRQSKLAAHQPVLDRIPVEGGTAHAWVSAYVEAGVDLSTLLSGRADALGARGPAMHLRGDAISDLRVLRETIARSLRRTPDAGAAVDHDLFGYLDLLAAMRDSGSEDPTPAAPVVPSPA